MAYYTQSQTDSIIERLLAGSAFMLDRAATRHAHYRVYHESLSELRSLSDRELDDIGMHRSTLKDVAREAADRQVKLK